MRLQALLLTGGILLTGLSGYLRAQPAPINTASGKYFGELPPGNKASLFARGLLSTPLYEHSAPAFSPAGETILWTVLDRGQPARILEMTRQGNNWSAPHAPAFADTSHDDFYPFFSPDGRQLIFSSRRPLPSDRPVGDMRLWVVTRKASGWGQPAPLDTVVSKGVEYAHSVSRQGTLFFSARELVNGEPQWKIYASRRSGANYLPPVALDARINDGSYVDGPCVSPDEQFLIFESDREGGLGSMDLYICFRKTNGGWSAPLNMGPKVNSQFAERFAGLSPDGKYLFFGSNREGSLPDIYWIDAGVIDRLRKNMK